MFVCGKVAAYESDYIDSSHPRVYLETSGESDVDNARRHKSSRRYYDPSVPLKEFFLDLRFQHLKLFKDALVKYPTKRRFEFTYVKINALIVLAKCVVRAASG